MQAVAAAHITNPGRGRQQQQENMASNQNKGS